VTTQLALRFDEVPITDKTQARYHAIAPCLAGKLSAADQARLLNLSYQKITRWLRDFRHRGMPALFPQTEFVREPYTPERVIVTLLYYKCCAPRASDRELARAIGAATDQPLHHQTVKSLLERFFFWRHKEFHGRIHYPVPADIRARRLEMVRLHLQGFSDLTIASLLTCHRKTVARWLKRWRAEAARQEQKALAEMQSWLFDISCAPRHPARKVNLGSIHAVLQLQQKYGYAGWFRIQGLLRAHFRIELSESTVKRIMRMNRRVHLAPRRPLKMTIRDPREGPPISRHPFEHAYIDIRYLDAKPEGRQLYSTLLLEGFSRTILAGSLTRRQDLGVILRLYYLALAQWGCWDEVISDHGKVFDSHAFKRVNRRLLINHEMYERGHPWQNLIESQFGIQARLGEYHWERCRSIDEAVEFHHQLIRDHNRLQHFAHIKRNDQKRAPLEVLGQAKGRTVDAATLHRAFSRQAWRRKTDERGFVRVNRWKIYVEEGLPRTPVQITYWDGKLRAEYNAQLLTEYRCRWDNAAQRPKHISHPQPHLHPFISPQPMLFDPLWLRDPVEGESPQPRPLKRAAGGAQQLRLYLGPKLVKR
jgi:transposase